MKWTLEMTDQSKVFFSMNLRYDFSNQTIREFLNELGSLAPSPGGGAAAALTGAIAISLVEMVTRINDARDMKKGNPCEMENAKKADGVRGEFLKLMEDDTRAFLDLSALPREPQDNPDYQEALRRCAATPFQMCQLALRGAEDALREKNRVSRWLASDLAEAGILFHSAFAAARLNVEINLRSIQDDDYRQLIKSDLDRMQIRTAAIKDELMGIL